MTIEAEARLRLPRKGFVALSAFALQLGVPFDQRARHDELLQQRLRAKSGRRHGDADQDGDKDREAPPHHATPSVVMDGPDMHDARQQHKEKQRQMKHMPQ
ncbi:hypothetical protein SSBR45G_56080 [Bradyrhizobium sp. SSBR45G]|nr:hypothetical protein SSBR45G_56080 [Bradyrhizobium sp. SSBR45G]GLH88088.1 hypothetical protein SSBR45R_55490 [Bradyrhizobium sp. SSBR45R]